MKTNDHHREHPRAPFTEQVRFFEWDRARSAHANEISAGGLFLRTPTPLNEGSLITLRMALPGYRAGFTALCRVVRTVRGSLLKESGMGVQFIDISAASRNLIQQYVQSRLVLAA